MLNYQRVSINGGFSIAMFTYMFTMFDYPRVIFLPWDAQAALQEPRFGAVLLVKQFAMEAMAQRW